jgi:hypothetical protein
MVLPTGAPVPIVGIGERALFAMEVGMNGHSVGGFQFIDEAVGAGPVTAGVPPQGGEGWGPARGRCIVIEGCAEGLEVHDRQVSRRFQGTEHGWNGLWV